jgi:transposase InsO family protein
VKQDARLRVEVAASHSASRRTYGSPRILRDLREDGHRVSRKRVARLMRELGLEGRRKRRFRATTDSQHRFPVASNVLMRDFDVDAPNTAWVTDIERHEALINRAVMKGRRHALVAAGAQKLRAA